MEMDRVHNRNSSISRLPEEQLYLIFEKLESNLDQQSFGLTCLHFLDIQNSSLRSLDLGYPCLSDRSFNINSAIVDRLLNRFRKLQFLSLSDCINVTDLGLSQLQNYGSKLHTLYLDGCSQITDIGLSAVASGCPSLSIINLSRCPIRDTGLEVLTESCRFLEEVNLSWCRKITDCGIWALSQNCRQLRAIKISHCDKVVGVSLQGCSPTLTCLEADHCAFDPMGVTGLLSGGGLEYLNLSCLEECSRGHGLSAIGLGIAANLKILNLRMCSFVTNDTIIRISKGCPLLQEWDLSYCSKIKKSAWESIGLYCHNLERLHVNGCEHLHDDGLLAIGNGCTHLSVIYMTDCFRITTSGIRKFRIRRGDVEIREEDQVMQITPSWAFTT